MSPLTHALVTTLVLCSACSHDWDRFMANGDGSIVVDSGASDTSSGDSGDSGDSGALREGLILHLPFDESGGTLTRETVTDMDLGSIEGGASFEEGVRGNALRFDGVDDRVVVSLGAPVDVGRRFSIGLWINANTLDGIIFGCEGAQHFMLRLDSSIGQIDGISARVNEDDWPTYSVLTTGGDLRTDEWRHLAFTANDGELKIFVDGVEADANAVGVPDPESEAFPTCHVSGSGYRYLEDDGIFEGAIDDLRLYDRALSVAEIASLADAP